MRKGIVDIVMVAAALVVILMIVLLVIFGRQAGIFQQSLSTDKVLKANDQCKAFTATALRKNDQLVDTDFDDMADVCDVCPNNYLSSKGDQVDTDTDKDGLSEEGLDKIHSPYNRGEYEVNLCDKEVLPSKSPQCANDWDDVRGKCQCGILENGQRTNAGFFMDRCATGPEWQDEKQKYVQPLIRQLLQRMYTQMRDLKFQQALELWDQESGNLRAAGFEVEVPFMDQVRALVAISKKSSLGDSDKGDLRRFISNDPDPGLMPQDSVGLLKAFAGSMLVDSAVTLSEKHALLTQAENDMGGMFAQPRMADVLRQQAQELTRGLVVQSVAKGRVNINETEYIELAQQGYVPPEMMILDPLLALQRRQLTPILVWQTSEGRIMLMPVFEVDKLIVEGVAASLAQFCSTNPCVNVTLPWGDGFIVWKVPPGGLDLPSLPPTRQILSLPPEIGTAGGLFATFRLWAARYLP